MTDNIDFDRKRLIQEAFRMEGLSEEECRSIFLDWALSLPEDVREQKAVAVMLERYATEDENHPMTQVLKAAQQRIDTPRRRGGWRGRQRPV